VIQGFSELKEEEEEGEKRGVLKIQNLDSS
jgi:hypothetical protein